MRFQAIYIGITLLFAACVNNDVRPTDPSWGKLNVMMNNMKWGSQYPYGFQTVAGGRYGPFQHCTTEYYSIISRLYNSNKFRREALIFNMAHFTPGIIGNYKVSKYKDLCDSVRIVYGSFFTIGEDGDVGQDVYDVLETEDNYLNIESFDAKTLEIKGKFQITFIITGRSLDPSSLPDTLRFTNGTFHTKIL